MRDNIASFGGDPGRVTVAGQSAGATSAACLMVMEQARGLFHRAILHSAAGPCFSTELAGEITARVAAAAGVEATAPALAAASPEALVAASDAVVERYREDATSGHLHYDPVIYGPVADGDVLPMDPLAAVAAGAAVDVELLVCHTTQEYWLLDAVGSSTKVTTEKRLTRFADDFGLPGTMVGDYRALMPGAFVLDLYLAVMGDLTFGEYSSRLAELQARAGGRAFMSRFDRRRAGPGGGVRAWHCADVPFAFGTHTESVVEFLIGGPPSPADHLLSRRMVSAWASIAATGAPGGERLDASGGLPWAPLDVNGGGAVHVWTADGDRDGPPVTPTRQLWHDFEYRPLTP